MADFDPEVVIIFLTGSIIWPIPPRFAIGNTIELIGGGGGGGMGSIYSPSGAGGGGGAGAYTRVNNFDPGSASFISMSVGEGGIAGVTGSSGGHGGHTIWNLNPESGSTSTAGSGSGGNVGGGGGPFGDTTGIGGPGGVGDFNGGDGGKGGQTSLNGGGGGGGGAGNLSGSGENGVTGSTDPDGPGLPGRGGQAGDIIGFTWMDSDTSQSVVAGSGSSGGSTNFVPTAGGEFAGGGGGGGVWKADLRRSGIGSPGANGMIILSYRERLFQMNAALIDEDITKQSGIIQRLRSNVIDDDSLQGLLLRQLILSGRAVDEDVIHGQSKTQFTLTGDIVDADVSTGRPVFSFTLIGGLADAAAISSSFGVITSFRGTALDNDEVKAHLANIHHFRLTIAGDADLSFGGPMSLGLLELAGFILDVGILTHVPVPPRDIAFFVIRDPIAIHDGPVLEEGFTNPTTLHGFGLRNLVVENMLFEIIPMNMKPDDDPTTTIFMESD